MFKKLKNIDSAFRDYRRYTLLVMAGSLLALCLTGWQAYRLVILSRNQVYILANGQTFTAKSGTRRENLPVEAKGHVRMFHEAFFSLDPDEKVIREHKQVWSYLADNSAKNLDDSLTMAGYYANVIAGNISQRIRVDSVKLDVSADPIGFKCYATLDIIRSVLHRQSNFSRQRVIEN